jgi:hypothetical protein
MLHVEKAANLKCLLFFITYHFLHQFCHLKHYFLLFQLYKLEAVEKLHRNLKYWIHWQFSIFLLANILLDVAKVHSSMDQTHLHIRNHVNNHLIQLYELDLLLDQSSFKLTFLP